MSRQLIGIITAILIAVPATCWAQPEGARSRPKIGLVLSGGAARGAAHVGVIKVLDEMRIPIDCIAGTSMGAIVGGLYASGMSAAELEQILLNADWSILLSDRPPRAERTYRRKADDFGFLVNFDVGINKHGLILPQGIVQGQNFTLALRRWLLPVATIDNFDLLPIPFRAVATDLISGQEVILSSGDLPTVVRASMSAPGVFKPVRMNHQVLVDGGVANNLPVGIAKSMGADILIVVDVGQPLAAEAELNSALEITSQIMTIMIRASTEEQKRLMTSKDVLITPELGLMGAQAFDLAAQGMVIGEAAARQSSAELTKLALSESAYAAHRRELLQVRPDSPTIHRVAIENESKLSTKVLQTRINDPRGTTLNVNQLEADITDIYGFDTFETVDYLITTDGVENELLIKSSAKSWGPNYVRFGINLEDDFNGNSNYNFAARFTKTEINARGGEIRADVVLGESSQFAAELYQPLDYTSRWFVNPRVSHQSENRGAFDAGNQIALFRSDLTELSVGVGRLFSNWGELRLTLAHRFADEQLLIGEPESGGASNDATSFQLSLGYDTIDRIAIPRFGTSLQLVWAGLRDGFGADLNVDVAQIDFLKPQTRGKHTFLHWWDAGSVSGPEDTSLNAFQLGGLFNLSGYAPGELQGDHRAMGRFLYYRRLGERNMPLLDTPVYLGASLEVGNVWSSRDEVTFNNTLTAGSVFVVFDTIIGPLYLAYGIAEGDRSSAYLFLGQTF